jgi:hypothetical protein
MPGCIGIGIGESRLEMGERRLSLIISSLGIQHDHMPAELQWTWENFASVFVRGLRTYDLLT